MSIRHIAFFLSPLAAVLCSVSLEAQPFGPVANPAGQGASSGFNPLGGSGADERPKNARTVIESDNGATFDNATSTAEFTGAVVVRDPQFDMTCDTLRAVLRADRKGLQRVVAAGNVVITQEKKNDRGDLVKSVGKCGKATYDLATGDVTLEEWPQVQQGINNQVATDKSTVMILNAKGRSRTVGPSRTMIVDTGEKAVTP